MTKRSKGWIWGIVVVLLIVASFFSGYFYHRWMAFGRSEYSVKCVDVLDGDTIEVEWFGDVLPLRIVGIDTFESRQGKKLKAQAAEWDLTEERALELGNLAKSTAMAWLKGKQITIKFASGKVDRDAFGRLLAYVYVGDVDYGKRLVEVGIAYTRPEKHIRGKFYDWPMSQAQNDKVGMWANK